MQYLLLLTLLLSFSGFQGVHNGIASSGKIPVNRNVQCWTNVSNPYQNRAKFWESESQHKIDTSNLKNNSWYSDALKSIQDKEYDIKFNSGEGVYSSPNRQQNLRSFYSANKFSLSPRNDSADKWKLELTTMGIFSNDVLVYSPAENPTVQHSSKTIRFNNNNNFTTEFINSKEGVRQNFILHKKPVNQKNSNQTISVQLKANKGWFVNKVHNREIHFAKATKTGYENKLSYNGLKVWDANNQELEAAFVVAKNMIKIQVQTKDAVYPITIDPLSSTPATTMESNQANANLGFSVSSAGDINGDGFSDVIAGAHNYDNSESNEGAAFVYHGSASGLSSTANIILESNQAGAYFGYSVATAGDVNNDGYSDIIIGARSYNNGVVSEGAAFVYHGSAIGVASTPNTTVSSSQTGANFGLRVASAGDVNGDGYSDVLVGSPLYDNVETDEGAAFVYHGSASGISTTVAIILEINQTGAYFGWSVASAGDVNGDGYSDIITGARNYTNVETDEGASFVYHGSATGISAIPARTMESNQANANFGISVASAGDVNGDGYSDVIVGAWLYDSGQTNEGVAFIYHGSATGISGPIATILQSNLAGAALGVSVASAGDINGDGYSDVIAGAHTYSNGESGEGAAFIYNGSAAGIISTPAYILEINQIGAQLGFSVASAGDVNGDGYSDIIIGAPNYSNGESAEGGAFVYHGSASGISTTAAAQLECNQEDAYMGTVASAGDVNGDGYSDVIVGAYLYDDGQNDEGSAFIYHGSATGISTIPATQVQSNLVNANLGRSVASAGDVNGDGYSDIIVGANTYTNGQSFEGAAYVYHGSASGISTTVAIVLESNQTGAYMGGSVASAGDVNGDGYGDIIVGAYRYNNGEGAEGSAFVYHGSAIGITSTVAALLESNQLGALLGYSVAGAGDVNGDGYSDVIVGAYYYDNGQTDEGVAFVYHGSATGVNTTAATLLEGNQANALFGFSVASAGDVNGDGYSDVVVGAAFYTNGETQEGAAYVFHGTATGVNSTPVLILEQNQAEALMGTSVASAGDVNGDGYSDIIIGAYNYDNGQTDEGVAFVYHGSVSGITLTAANLLEINQGSAAFGFSVAGAGDVNGDGYSDVIVGAYKYTNVESLEGAAFVYLGNAGGGLRNNLRLYNQDLVTPIQRINVTEPNLFGAGLFAKSPLGRVKGKLVWEVKRQGDAFSGNPITNSTAFLAKQPSFADLGIAGTELKYNVQKVGSKNNKIRTRVEYDRVTAITGQIYGPWRYPAGYTQGAHGMNSVPLPIKLISFNGQFINEDDVQLKWITTNEINMQTYYVERSTDGINFTTVGDSPATGLGSNRTDYALIDKNVQHNLLYYRLKLKDKAAEISYTKTITLSRSKIVKGFIAPNPVLRGNDARLILQSSTDKNKVNISIFNSNGQLVFTDNKLLMRGENKIRISTNKLATGIYAMKILGDGINEQYRMLVQ